MMVTARATTVEPTPGDSLDYRCVVDPATLDPDARLVPGARVQVVHEGFEVRFIESTGPVFRKAGEWGS